MAEENKKININSFFERTEEVGGMAGKALQNSELNASAIQANKTLINSLSVTIEAMKTEIRDIANYIVIENKLEKDKKEDAKFEAEDAKQKQELKDRLLAAGKQGPKGDKGEPAPPVPEGKSSGGNFITGLLKALAVAGTAVAAAKFLTPVILPIITKTLLPAISKGLTFVIGKTIGGIGGFFTKGLSSLAKLPIVGKSFGTLAKGLSSKFGGFSKTVAGIVASLFTLDLLKGGSAKASESNMSLSAGGEGGIAEDLKLDDSKIKEKQESKQKEKEVKSKKKGNITPKPAMEVGKFKPAPPEKPKGFKRFLAGAGDFITGGRFDLDKRGSSVTDKLSVPAAIVNAVAPPPKPDNSGIAPANTFSNTSQAVIRPTSPTIPFIRTVKNQYLSTNPNTNKLPPEIARLIQ